MPSLSELCLLSDSGPNVLQDFFILTSFFISNYEKRIKGWEKAFFLPKSVSIEQTSSYYNFFNFFLPTEEHFSLKIKSLKSNFLEISKFGETGGESLKININSIFSKKDTVEIKYYIEKLVSITTDGTFVNTSSINGLMTQIKRDWQDWIEPMHYSLLKDAFDKSGFNEIDKIC